MLSPVLAVQDRLVLTDVTCYCLRAKYVMLLVWLTAVNPPALVRACKAVMLRAQIAPLAALLLRHIDAAAVISVSP